MDPVARYREAARLAESGLTEERIGVRMGLHRLAVCRLLALRTLDPDLLAVFAEARASLAALREIAGYSPAAQNAALGELRRMAAMSRRRITRRDVAPVMARHARDLDRAPFPTTNCRACLRRTGAQMDFFGGVPEGLGRCLDAACFARNVNAVAMRRARWPKQLRANARKPKTEKERQ